MNAENKSISVIEPVSAAMERTKILLFRPFNLEKWFIIGFCAWLANLSGGGACSVLNIRPDKGTGTQTAQAVAKILGFVREHIVIVSITAGLAVMFLITIFLLCLWLGSRGQFMFLDCLAKNKAQVTHPWKTFKQQANSLFGFRLLVVLISSVVIFALGISMAAILAIVKQSAINSIIAGVVCLAVIMLIFMVVSLLGLVGVLTTDFVIPIMYLQRINILAGWQKFLPLLGQHFWKIMLYLFFKLLIGLCLGAIAIAVVLLGCCCCCIGVVALIPYIGTVILLPFPSFSRLYALCFFRQFGSEFDVFAAVV